MKNLALIVAAGGGKRMGTKIPKQYLPFNGKPVLAHSIEAFLNHPQIDSIRVVIATGDKLYDSLNLKSAKLLPPVTGGLTRQDSVKLGLQSLKDLKPKNVLIHDAARPFVSTEIIDEVLKALGEHPVVIPLIDLKDSVRYAGKVIDREELKLVQTPQGFDYQTILKAHETAQGKYTDDAQVAEANGVKISFVAGNEKNVKITTSEDLKNSPDFRTGIGFDIHEFETGTHLTICGVKIPHSHQLKGHSDADVGLHALTDAILGAIGAGDIGEHFPPADPKWRNADSAKFVAHALKLVHSKNGEIANIDLTVICEEPKLTPFKAQMRQRVAEILQIPQDCVNIKATTTEKLGFIGRQEGIAAQAIAMIRFLR